MMRVDSARLSEAINACFDLSMDNRLAADQRAGFLATGKRLRGSLLNLLTAQFNDGTQEVTDANGRLGQVATLLADRARVLSDAADALDQAGRLVKILDDLLKIAAQFH